MADVDLAVRSTDARFLELLRVYLGPFRVERASNPYVFSADCGVGKTMAGGKPVRGRARLYVGGLKIFEGTAQEEMTGRLISAVRDLRTRQASTVIQIRAGGVAVGSEALILPSPPQPHLPALVAELVRAGAGYLGDEVVDIDPVLRRVHGTSLPLLLDRSDLPEFSELGREPPRRAWLGEDPARLGARTPRWPVPVHELGGSLAPPTAPRWIVFPSFEPGARSEMHAMAPSEALFRLIESGLNLHIWQDRALVLMRELLEAASAYHLVVGSLPEAGQVLSDEVRYLRR